MQKVPNLIVLRTFSKIHGLAGLRVGYSISSEAVAKRFADLSLAKGIKVGRPFDGYDTWSRTTIGTHDRTMNP